MKFRSDFLWIVSILLEIAIFAGIVSLLYGLSLISEFLIVVFTLSTNSAIPLMGSIMLILIIQNLLPTSRGSWKMYIFLHIFCVLLSTVLIYFVAINFSWYSFADFSAYVISIGLVVMILVLLPRLHRALRPNNLKLVRNKS